MIGWLQGHIVDKPDLGKLVIDVNGVGYDVETSLTTFFHLDGASDKKVGLHIHTNVREDAITLFGFLDKQERSLFRTLIKVNGIGPKVAMSILSSSTPSEFIHCVQTKNRDYLTKLPGIGKKTAERLLIELKDAITSFEDTSNPSTAAVSNQKGYLDVDEAVNALISLGYKQQAATSAVKKIDNGQMSCEELIRKALKSLAVL